MTKRIELDLPEPEKDDALIGWKVDFDFLKELQLRVINMPTHEYISLEAVEDFLFVLLEKSSPNLENSHD